MPSFLAKILTVVLEKLAQNVVELVQKIDLSWVKIEKKKHWHDVSLCFFSHQAFSNTEKIETQEKTRHS